MGDTEHTAAARLVTLLDALSESDSSSRGGLTVTELARAMGRDCFFVSRQLRPLVELGLVERSGRVQAQPGVAVVHDRFQGRGSAVVAVGAAGDAPGHYDISVTCAEQSFLPVVRDTGDRRPLHLAQLLRRQLRQPSTEERS